ILDDEQAEGEAEGALRVRRYALAFVRSEPEQRDAERHARDLDARRRAEEEQGDGSPRDAAGQRLRDLVVREKDRRDDVHRPTKGGAPLHGSDLAALFRRTLRRASSPQCPWTTYTLSRSGARRTVFEVRMSPANGCRSCSSCASRTRFGASSPRRCSTAWRREAGVPKVRASKPHRRLIRSSLTCFGRLGSPSARRRLAS